MSQAHVYPVYKELMPKDLPLTSLFLDPNNPRFVNDDWHTVPDENIDLDGEQGKTTDRLTRNFAVDKLVMNMEVNGYLPIDRIVVREFEVGKYVVLEGNRRICGAKILRMKPALPQEIAESLEMIPCLVYTGTSSDASAVFQGLRHITGIREWSAFNKAKLLVDLMEEENLSLTDVGKRFGLTSHGAGQWVRGYQAFKQASLESDYIKEVNERAYPYFQELFNRSNNTIREWLDWSDSDKIFRDELHLNEFLSWLYPRSSGDNEDSDSLGDWERRKLPRAADVRTLSFLLTDDEAEFQQFRNGIVDIEQAYSMALQRKYQEKSVGPSDATEKVFHALKQCISSLDNIPFKMLKDEQYLPRLVSDLDKLKELIERIRPESY